MAHKIKADITKIRGGGRRTVHVKTISDRTLSPKSNYGLSNKQNTCTTNALGYAPLICTALFVAPKYYRGLATRISHVTLKVSANFTVKFKYNYRDFPLNFLTPEALFS